MQENCISTPTTIRGVASTLKSEFFVENKDKSLKKTFDVCQEVIIDWFQVTIFPQRNYKFMSQILLYNDYATSDRIIPVLFKELFNINSSDIIEDVHGLNGYDISFSYKDINIMYNSGREDMGINILLKGSGCRDFEDLGLSWTDLFNKLIKFEINFNRIDIAIDSFNSNYFDLDLLRKYLFNCLVVSRFKTLFQVNERYISNYLDKGDMIQFGSKASNIEITFYNKCLERESKGYVVDYNINLWIRTELRFRHEKAEQLFKLISNNDNYMELVKSVLYDYLDFKTPNSKDTNISRRKTVKWWLDYLNDCSKMHLSTRSRERDITKIYKWLLNNTSKSEFMLYLAKTPNFKVDDITSDLMYEKFIKGSTKISNKDLQIINNSRIKDNMPIITREEILDYIQDVKNQYVI